MTKLYTRVSHDFDPASPTGVIVAGEHLDDTYGFSELGYDQVDYDRAPVVYEVVPNVTDFANTERCVQVLRAAGFPIFDTHDDFNAAVAAGTASGTWANDDYICLEESEINQLLLDERMRETLEQAGIYAVRDWVAVSNTQPEFTILWKAETFSLVGPVQLEPTGNARSPYHVALAGSQASTPRI